MSTPSAPKLDLPEPSEVPAIVRAEIRGRIYTFTELSIDDYDKLVKQATTKEIDPETNREEEMVDNTVLMRLMIRKVISPAIPAPELGAKGTRLYRAISKIINELHFGDEPVKMVDEDGNASEGDSKGNA